MTNIHNISDIDVSTDTGKLLVATLTMLSNESLIPKSYTEILENANALVEHMYGKIEKEEFTHCV
jgi:hypothetical protein